MSRSEEVDKTIRAAIARAPHAHIFTWAANSTWTNTEPPPDTRCTCGLSYQEIKDQIKDVQQGNAEDYAKWPSPKNSAI